MKQEVKINQTDYTVFILVRDTSGNAKTTLVFGDIDLAYARVETDNDVTTADVAPATLASLTAAHDDWGFLLVSDTDHPGLYRLDIADEVFAIGAWSAVVTLTGAGLEPSHLEFVMKPESPYSEVIPPSVAEFEARTIVAGDYFDPDNDDVAVVTLVTTTTTNTDMRGTDGVSLVIPPSVAQFNARTIVSADYVVVGDTIAGVTNVGTVTGNVDGSVGSVTGAVGSVTGAVGSVTGSVGSVVGAVGSVTGSVGSVVGAVGSVAGNVGGLVVGTVAGVTPAAVGAAMALTAAAVDAILDEAVEGAITLRQVQRVVLAYLAGETDGGGTVTIHFRDLADTLNRITMTVDADGDRSGVALNLA